MTGKFSDFIARHSETNGVQNLRIDGTIIEAIYERTNKTPTGTPLFSKSGLCPELPDGDGIAELADRLDRRRRCET